MANGEAPDLVVVGHVRRPHGVQGEVVVEVLSENPERFRPGAKLLAPGKDGCLETLRIVSARPHRGALLVLFEGLEDRGEVARLRGSQLVIEAADVGKAPDGSYYYFELVGCACVDRSFGDLGEVISIREDGGGLLLEIRDSHRTVLVPFVREYLCSVQIERRLIELDLPEGLLEICASL